jgi:hypothetical protein
MALIAASTVGCNDQSGTAAQQGAGAASAASAGASIGGSSCASSTRSGMINCAADALAIAGAPITDVLVGAAYHFQPSLVARGAVPLRFNIENKPRWASFDAATGSLTGTPSAADVGTYEHILISATNGLGRAALPEFSISVTQTAMGSVTVSWVPPTTNSDGTPITNLAGYRISYGTSPTALLQTISVATPGLTNYLIDNLTPGIWYFSIEAINSQGLNSAPSGIVAVTITGS